MLWLWIQALFVSNILNDVGKKLRIIIPPQTLWRVYCFHVVRPCVHNILFPYHLEESLLEFHQTLQTYLYIQDNIFDKKVRARGQLY